MTRRRDFVARAASAFGAMALAPLFPAAGSAFGGPLPGDGLPDDEAFWAGVRRRYTLDRRLVNLDHGWTNPASRESVEALVAAAREVESLPADHLFRLRREVTNSTVREGLARVLGVPPTEVALVRNATEALDTVLLGFPLAAGDEVVCSAHDYYAMLDALEQRRARDGIVIRMLVPPVPAPSLEALAELYEAAMGPRTRLVLLTHPSNLTGQLLPVARIAEAAHRVGARVVVDGAQSLGLLEEAVAALGCDFYGASAHKWVGAPVSLGVLWMRPELTGQLWPLLPPSPRAMGMARFETTGTRPEHVNAAAVPALELHFSLGAARKLARLRYLQEYWRERVARALPSVRFTLAGPEMGCSLCTVEIPGRDPVEVYRTLRERHGILVQPMSGGTRDPSIRGVRVTPNVFASLGELDRLAAALATG